MTERLILFELECVLILRKGPLKKLSPNQFPVAFCLQASCMVCRGAYVQKRVFERGPCVQPGKRNGPYELGRFTTIPGGG